MPRKLKIYSFVVTFHDGHTQELKGWNTLYERNKVMKTWQANPAVKSCRKVMKDL